MNELKFRYVFKNKVFGDISIYYLTLKQVEQGAVSKILNSGMKGNGYEVISRDRYVGFKNKNGKEFYEGDIQSGVFYNHNTQSYDKKNGYIIFDNTRFYLHEINGKRNCEINRYKEIIGNRFENSELLK